MTFMLFCGAVGFLVAGFHGAAVGLVVGFLVLVVLGL